MGLLSAAFGVMLSGYVMTKLKPSARTISAWNLIVEIFGVGCMILYAYLGCSEIEYQAGKSSEGRLVFLSLLYLMQEKPFCSL